jgi:hypothetical protein
MLIRNVPTELRSAEWMIRISSSQAANSDRLRNAADCTAQVMRNLKEVTMRGMVPKEPRSLYLKEKDAEIRQGAERIGLPRKIAYCRERSVVKSRIGGHALVLLDRKAHYCPNFIESKLDVQI